MNPWSYVSARALAALKSITPHPRIGEADIELGMSLDGKLVRAKEWMKERGIEPALVHRKRRKTDVDTTKEQT